MKVLDKAAFFGGAMVFALTLSGCASRGRPPSSAPVTASPVAMRAGPSAAPSHPQPWASPPGWALPQAWTAPPAWPLPPAWPVPPGLSAPGGGAPPASWPFPWLAIPPAAPPQHPGKAPAATTGAPAAVAYARSRLGTPYCWGGNGPGCYDCSGLTTASWKAGGKAIPRTSEAQGRDLPQVALDKIAPGDILWRSGHVALYVGNGQVIHAPRTGEVVKIAPATGFTKAVRPQ